MSTSRTIFAVTYIYEMIGMVLVEAATAKQARARIAKAIERNGELPTTDHGDRNWEITDCEAANVPEPELRPERLVPAELYARENGGR